MSEQMSYEQQKALDLRMAVRKARQEHQQRMAELRDQKRAMCPHDGREWSEDDDHTLGLLIESGRNRDECAAILGRTDKSVSVRASQKGWRFGRDHLIGTGWSPPYATIPNEERARLVEMDARFIRRLALAYQRGEFPGQDGLRLVG